MFFRRKLSILVFCLMMGAIGLKAQGWTNMNGGYTIYAIPGQVIHLSCCVIYLGGGQCFDPPSTMVFKAPYPNPYCYLGVGGMRSWGRVVGESGCVRYIQGGVFIPPSISSSVTDKVYPGRCGQFSGELDGPPWTIVIKADQIPDECSEAGDPVNIMDGSFNLESTDLSSGNSNGVSLIRTYKSRERNIYFVDKPTYHKLLLPFGEGGWMHNYVKFLVIMEDSGNIYYKIRDGNEIRDVIYVKKSGGDSIVFANVYKVHNGLVEIDANHWKYIKSDGTIEFYSRSSVFPRVALIDSVRQFDETTLRFGYSADTLKYVIDKWGDSLKFYYKIYCGSPMLEKVKISGKNEWMEYKYIKINSLYQGVIDTLCRLSQIIKHTPGNEIIVFDRYYYNRDLVPGVDTGVDLKTDIVTWIPPQRAYNEDNDTSLTAYNNHRLTGYRVNNWYGKYPVEGVYYQEVVSGDTILEKSYIKRFYSGNHRVDSVYVYHWEDLPELGAHDPNDTSFTPSTTGYDYLEIIRYNPIGTRSSVTVAGKTTRYLSYDSDYNPLLVVEPDGDTIRYEYYAYTVGNKTRYSSYPTKIVYPGRDSVLNHYSRPDPDNPYYIRLDWTIDEEGRKTVYTYDANNYTDKIILDDRYVAGKGVVDIVTDYDYNAVGNLLRVEDPEGVITYYQYSDNDNGPFLLKSGVDIGRDGDEDNDILTIYSYNNLGKIEKKIEARVNPLVIDTTRYQYDVMGKLSKIVYPNGDYEEFIYDKAGNLIQKKSLDTLGNSVTTHEYKSRPFGKLKQVKEYAGAQTYTTKYDYNQDGKLVKFTNANNKTINYKYKQDKLVSTHYPDGTKDSLGYYPCGCYLLFKMDRNGEVTQYLYDKRDRLKKKLYYNSLSDYNSYNPSDSLVYYYNKVGEIIRTKDKTGDIIYKRDDVGNLDTVKVYSLYTNVYQYDLSGRKTHFKSYKYGNPSQVYLEQTFQYDDAGRDISTTVAGKRWDLSYYDNNALKEISYPEISGGSNRLSESYQIGKRGEITEIFTGLNHNITNLLTNPGFETGNLTGWNGYPQAGATKWYIDATDNIVEFSCGNTHGTGNPYHSWQVTSSVKKEGNYSLYSPYSPTEPYSDVEFLLQHFDLSDYGYPFEASAWIKTSGLEDGVWIGVILWADYPDSIRVLADRWSERITGTQDWKKVTVTIDDEGYDVNNLKGIFYIERIRGNGAVWVDDIRLEKGDTLQNAKITYQYDRRANRNYSYIKLPDGTEEEQIYRYDNLNRLKKSVFREPGKPTSQQYVYTYDPVGNRTERTAIGYPSHLEYIYNTDNNRLLSITELGEQYTYNNRGDLLTATDGYTFSYDREGRLEKITQSTGGQIHKLKFLYSSEGRRIRKIDSSATKVDTTYYVYDGMFAVAELNGHLDLKSKYVYTNGMLVGRIDSDGKLYQYFHDGLGSITMICDSTGNYRNLYLYDDFGNFRKKTENVPNHYYYTGQERDEEPSGLYNLRARYYASTIGRFTQEDPVLDVENGELGLNNCNLCRGLKINLLITSVESPQALNAYIYAINNPTNILDPTGEIVQIAFNPCLYCSACAGGALFGCFVGCKYAPDYKQCVKECIKSIPCERLWPHKDDPISGICFGMCTICGLKIIGKDALPLPNMGNK